MRLEFSPSDPIPKSDASSSPNRQPNPATQICETSRIPNNPSIFNSVRASFSRPVHSSGQSAPACGEIVLTPALEDLIALTPALLALEDGCIFEGQSIGAP